MAITTYTGTGGAHALFRKLAELWEFQKIVSTADEDFSDPAATGWFELWLTDEVYIRYAAGDGLTSGCNSAGLTEPFFPLVNGADTRAWKIVKTDCGVAFGVDADNATAFIGRTLRHDGVESIGIVMKHASDTYNHWVLTDGMLSAENRSFSNSVSVHYTNLFTMAAINVPVYFPDIYRINSSPQTTNRVTQIGSDLYFCNRYVALRDTAAATGSTDLSGYYDAQQTDAKITAVETVLMKEIAVVTDAAQAAQKTADTAMSAAIAAQDAANEAKTTAAENIEEIAVVNAEMQKLQKSHQEEIKVYVDAAGSDTNTGLTASAAFATLERALEVTAAYGMTEIQLAAGEYDAPESQYYIYSRDLRITGAGKDKTTVYGKLYAHDSNFEIKSLTLDGTKNTSTGASPLTASKGSSVKVDGCTVNAATSNNGLYVTGGAHMFVADSEIIGFVTRMMYMTVDAEAVLSNVTCTTASTSENIMAGATAFLRMVDCPDLTYTTQHAGIVFVDGVQRSPNDNQKKNLETLHERGNDRRRRSRSDGKSLRRIRFKTEES